jgi:P-type Ca2+ transporter type 2C
MPGHNPSLSYPSPSTSSTYTRRSSHYPPRPASPPACTYFSPSNPDDHDMHPTPGAQAHFSYSTTLKRHGISSNTPRSPNFPTFDSIRSAVTEQGPSALWSKLVSLVRGVNDGGSPEQNGYLPTPKTEDTPSAKYSCFDAEVRLLAIPTPCFS